MDLRKTIQEVRATKQLLLRLSEDLYRKGDFSGMTTVKSITDELDLFLAELQYTNVENIKLDPRPVERRARDLNGAIKYIFTSRDKDPGLGLSEELMEIRLGILSIKEAVHAFKSNRQPQLRDVNPRSVFGRTIKSTEKKAVAQQKVTQLKDLKAKISSYIEYYRKQGINVDRLRASLKYREYNQVADAYNKYHQDIQKLEGLKAKIKAIKNKEHENDKEKLLEMCKDPSGIEEIQDILDFIDEKVNNPRGLRDRGDSWIKAYYKKKKKEAEEGGGGGGLGGIPSKKGGGISIPSSASSKPQSGGGGGFNIPSSKQDVSIPSAAPPPAAAPTPPVAATPPPQNVAPTPAPAAPNVPAPAYTPPPAAAPPPAYAAPPVAPAAPAYAQPPTPPMAPASGGGGYQGRSLEELAENGTKEEWAYLFNIVMRNEVQIDLPAVDPEMGKFPDYGYKNLVKLLLENKDMTRMITEERDISGFKVIALSTYLRGDENTTRGLAALCNLILMGEAVYNPIMETEFKYLNLFLDAGSPMEKDGKTKTWKISNVSGEKTVTAVIEDGEWTYKVQ
jgi:hypothetical protein